MCQSSQWQKPSSRPFPFCAGVWFASICQQRCPSHSPQSRGDLRRAAPLLQGQAARPRALSALPARQPQRRQRAGDPRGRVRRPTPPLKGAALRGQECRRGLRHAGQPAEWGAGPTGRLRLPA